MAYRSKSRLTYPASEILEAYRLVTLLPTGQIAYNDAATKPLGATECPAQGTGQRIGVRLLNTEGTVEIEASGTVVLGDDVIAAQDGKVAKASGAGVLIGMRSVPDEEQLVENGRVVCRDCGEPIPAARLAACPEACRCVVCQEAAEASGDR